MCVAKLGSATGQSLKMFVKMTGADAPVFMFQPLLAASFSPETETIIVSQTVNSAIAMWCHSSGRFGLLEEAEEPPVRSLRVKDCYLRPSLRALCRHVRMAEQGLGNH